MQQVLNHGRKMAQGLKQLRETRRVDKRTALTKKRAARLER